MLYSIYLPPDIETFLDPSAIANLVYSSAQFVVMLCPFKFFGSKEIGLDKILYFLP